MVPIPVQQAVGDDESASLEVPVVAIAGVGAAVLLVVAAVFMPLVVIPAGIVGLAVAAAGGRVLAVVVVAVIVGAGVAGLRIDHAHRQVTPAIVGDSPAVQPTQPVVVSPPGGDRDAR
jgi:hypothetical protein